MLSIGALYWFIKGLVCTSCVLVLLTGLSQAWIVHPVYWCSLLVYQMPDVYVLLAVTHRRSLAFRIELAAVAARVD